MSRVVSSRFGISAAGWRDRLPCEGQNVIDRCRIPGLALDKLLQFFLEAVVPLPGQIRTLSAPGWCTSSSRPGARASRA